MKSNIGGLDRTLRIIAGLILLITSIFIIKSGIWMAIFAAVGIVLVLTGFLRFCAMYVLCGTNTCPVKITDRK